MSKILKFIMLSEEAEGFRRDYEVPYDMDLLDFHDFICDDLNYDASNFSSFFTADDEWNKMQEYTLVDMQDEESGAVAIPMAGTILGQTVKAKRGRLIFMFDIFAGRVMYLEVADVAEADEKYNYPRTAYDAGDPPPQLDAESLTSEDSPFNDAMEEFMDFEGSDNNSMYDDEL